MALTTDEHAGAVAAGRPRDGLREQAILDAAIELLAEVGYDRMSIDTLAARAHASKATIYRRWTGKAAVVAEAVRRRKCDIDSCDPDTGSLRGDLLALICASGAEAGEERALLTGVLRAMHVDEELNELMHLHVIDRKHDAVRGAIARAVTRGEIASDAGAETMIDVVQAVVMNRLVVEGGVFDEAFAKWIVDDIALPLLRR